VGVSAFCKGLCFDGILLKQKHDAFNSLSKISQLCRLVHTNYCSQHGFAASWAGQTYFGILSLPIITYGLDRLLIVLPF
jgi:hypothetical protein